MAPTLVPWAEDARPAAERFRIDVRRPSRVGVIVRSATVLFAGALNLGEAPSNPGGRRAVVIDGDTGDEVATLVERWGDDVANEVDGAVADLARLDVATFAARWLPVTTAPC